MSNQQNAILKTKQVTEKAALMEALCEMESNPSLARFKKLKYVFLVANDANKAEIKKAVELLYKDQKISVEKVNTINLPRKKKNARGKRKMGYTAPIRKAIVTLKEGDKIDFEL